MDKSPDLPAHWDPSSQLSGRRDPSGGDRYDGAQDGLLTATTTFAEAGVRVLPGVSQARRPPDRPFYVVFSTGSAAADLWAFGEDDLAEAALVLPDDDMLELWTAAARFYDASYPLPVEGRRITLGHVIPFACMDRVEGRLRPLARSRRRAESKMPAHIRDARDQSQKSLSALQMRLIHNV